MSLAFIASQFNPEIHFFPGLPDNPVMTEMPVPDFIEVRNFNFYYGNLHALQAVSVTIPERCITAFMGPSGSGKSTMLGSFNRINELIPGTRCSGDIIVGGRSVFSSGLKLMNLRRAIGMVFQEANPFPRSIYENIACCVRLGGEKRRDIIDEQVRESLMRVALWNEVKDRLHQDAMTLSGGQMQRLCIARALACDPQILLLDEPCSSLDPFVVGQIEELLQELKKNYTIILATHNVTQVARCAEYVGFFQQGRIVEFGPTTEIFEKPKQRTALDYMIKGVSW